MTNDNGTLPENPSLVRRALHMLSTRVFDSAAVATHSTLINLTSYFYLFGGLAAIAVPFFPHWPANASATVYISVGVIAVCTSALIFLLGVRLPRWFFEPAVLFGTLLISFVLVSSGSAAMATACAFLYLYVVVDSALFFSLRGMVRQYGVMLVASLWSLHHMGVPPGALFMLEVAIAVTMMAVAWAARAVHVHERDQLTKLVNRRVFDETVTRALASNQDRHESLCLVVFGLDDFQGVNRSQGQHGADELLRKIAATWQQRTPESATLSRLTGDKFGLLLPGMGTTAAARIADGFRALLPAGMTASAGVSVWESGDTPSTLVGRAESAALDAKTCGRDTTMIYGDPARQADSIVLALQKQEFVLEYQPIFQLPDRTIVSYEALIHWRRPGRGRVSPVHFIPIAERTGAIHALGRWVMDEVARTIAVNNRAGRAASIAINASMLELRAPGYPESVRQTLDRHGIQAAQLTVEVTEAVFDGNNPGVLNTIHALKDIGVKVAIDDFGAGYSSLRWLDRFPADILKIDKSFVDTITTSDQELKVLSKIVSLGHDLGLTVLAEGVETELQAGVLQRLGVERIQGFLLGRPMPLDQGLLPAVTKL